MKTQSSSPIIFKLVMLLMTAVLLCSCNAHQQEREFQKYLCQCNADGSNFQLLCRNNYSTVTFSPYSLRLFSYPFRIEYGMGDDLFVFRDDGVLRYNQESHKWQAYLQEDGFKYRDSNYFYSPAETGDYFFKTASRLFRVQRDGLGQDLLLSNVVSCVGIPYQPKLSVLTSNGIMKMENGVLDQTTVFLPTGTTRAYYFAEAETIVYLWQDKFWRCAADGSDQELLYTPNSSVLGYRCFYPIDEAGSFITTNRFEGDENILLIDATDGSIQDLGKAIFSLRPDFQYLPFQISMSSDRAKLLFFDSTALYLYDLSSKQRETVLIGGINNFNLRNISSASLSADGTKISFIADVYKYK